MNTVKKLSLLSAAVALACATASHAQSVVPLTYSGPTEGFWSLANNWTLIGSGDSPAFPPDEDPDGDGSILNSTLLDTNAFISLDPTADPDPLPATSASSSALIVSANVTLTASSPETSLTINRVTASLLPALEIATGTTLTLDTNTALVIQDFGLGGAFSINNGSTLQMNSGSKFRHIGFSNSNGPLNVDFGHINLNNADFAVQKGLIIGPLSSFTVDGGPQSTYSISGTLDVFGTANLGSPNDLGYFEDVILRSGGSFATGNLSQYFSTPSLTINSDSTFNIDIDSDAAHDIFDISSDFSLSPTDTTLVVDFTGQNLPEIGTEIHVFRTGNPVENLFQNLISNGRALWEQVLVNDEDNGTYGIALRLTAILPPLFLTGDFNFDGGVDASDIDPFVLAANEGDPFASYIASFQESFALLYPGQTLTAEIINSIGDFNGDGGVDASDIDPFVIFANNGGTAISAIPEPTSLALLAPLALTLTRSRRRR